MRTAWRWHTSAAAEEGGARCGEVVSGAGRTVLTGGGLSGSNGERSLGEPRRRPELGRPAHSDFRPNIRGKFLFVGEDKFVAKGVSYGAFRPNAEKEEYHRVDQLHHDFEMMSRFGINTVRIPHTTPPRHLLDIAQQHGLRVMVGLSAEQYVGFLIDTAKQPPDVRALVKRKVEVVRGHPALLCYAIGNEIPAPVARWLGPERVERYLKRIYMYSKRDRSYRTRHVRQLSLYRIFETRFFRLTVL